MALILRPPGQRESLRLRLEQLAFWRHTWSVLAATLLACGVGAFALALSLGLDCLLTLSAPVRALLLVGWLIVVMQMLSRIPIRSRFRAEDIAFDAETRFSDFNDVLASATEFEQMESRNAFHVAAIRHAERVSEPFEWNRLLPLSRLGWSVAITAIGVVALIAALTAGGPTALQRFLRPWAAIYWPNRTHISLGEYPRLIATGDSWPLPFTVSGELPETASIALRFGTTEDTITVPLVVNDDGAMASVNLDAGRVPACFDFRVLAGDGSTPWQSVRVAPPPKLDPWKLHLDYPRYTGWKAIDLSPGTVSIEAVCGTRLTVTATADRSITTATLVLQDPDPTLQHCVAVAPLAGLLNPAAAFIVPMPVTITDGRTLTVSFEPPFPGVYALRFTDAEGLSGTQRIECRMFADPPPTATLQRPDAGDGFDVLPTAREVLDAFAEDRTFAARRLWLEYHYEGELWQSRPLATHRTADLAILADKRLLQLSTLTHADGRELAAGDVITLRVAADDFDDRTLGKPPGFSREITLRLHSRASLEALLQKWLAGLRDPLKRANDAHTAGKDEDVKQLVGETLRGEIEKAKAMVKANALPTSATTARLDALAKTLRRLDETLLPAMTPETRPTVTRELQSALAELDRWAGLAELQSDAHGLTDLLRKAGETLKAVQSKTAGGLPRETLPPAQRAALDDAAAEFKRAAEAMAALRGKAEAVRDTRKNPNEVDRLEKAIRAGSGGDAFAKAEADVKANRLADAETARADAERSARAMADALIGRDDAPDELRRKNKELASEVKSLRDELGKSPADDTLRKKLDALTEKAAGQDRDAAESLQRAAAALEKNDPATTDQELKKAEERLQREAENAKPRDEKVNEVLNGLKALRTRQHAAIETAGKLSAEAANTQRWTRPLAAGLVTLADEERTLAKELKAFAETSLTDAIVFAKLAADAADAMERAAERLKERKDDALSKPFDPAVERMADAAVSQPMTDALQRLDFILKALEDQPKPKAKEQAAPPMPAPMPMPMANGKPPPLAQLKALRDWQADLRLRTVEFSNAHPDAAKYTDDDRAAVSELQREQTEITRLFDALRESLTPPGELP